MENRKWKIFIVTHKKFYPELYMVDPMFSNENYCILNVGPYNKIENQEGFETIDQKSLDTFQPLGAWWAESEGIYNVWKKGIQKDLDYIGFTHYDKELRLIKRNIHLKQETNITKCINEYISNRGKAHISMENHPTKKMYRMRVLADVTKPNLLVGPGLNAFDYILRDYNTFFQTNYNIKDFLQRKKINLCSCFLIDVATFEKMMLFFDWIITNRRIDDFDTAHRYRIQGGLMERYFGVFLMFEYYDCLDLSTIHHYNSGLK